MKIKFSVLLFLSICFLKNASAQAQDGYNMWYQYLMSARLTNKSTLTALSQYRSFDFAYDTRLFLVSTYIDYEVLPDVRPAAGFMFLTLESYRDDETKRIRYEKRPFQQISLKSNIGRVSASHRFRVEERFLNNPNQFIVRLRYLISLNIPFYKTGGKEQFYGIFKNEIRINALKKGVFDSNRITAGVGLKIGKTSAVEVAFVNQLEEGPSSNYGALMFRQSFDWRKNNKNKIKN